MFEATKVGISIPKIALKAVYADIEFDLSWKNKDQYLQVISVRFIQFTVCFWSGEIGQKVFSAFDNIFHVYLMRGFQKYERNWILTMAFWATCKIAQPIQPIW